MKIVNLDKPIWKQLGRMRVFIPSKQLISLALSPLFLVSLLSSCIFLQHKSIKPQIEIPDSWNAKIHASLKKEPLNERQLSTWWESFEDPVLSSLIREAMERNLDVKNALSKVREAEARKYLAKANFFPVVGLSGIFNISRRAAEKITKETYEAGFQSSWTADIFGGIRASYEASEFDLQSSKEYALGVLNNLVSQVVKTYIEIRTLQNRIKEAENSLKVQEEIYELIKKEYDVGLKDELTVNQILYTVESTRSSIPNLTSQLEEAKNRLSILLGRAPGNLSEEIDKPGPVPCPSVNPMLGIPGEVIKQRPDIRQVEKKLLAQISRVKAAYSELYPGLSLEGSFAFQSSSLGNLSASRAWTISFGPKILWTLFKGQAIRHNIELQKVIEEQYLIEYEKTIIKAIEEVENALTAYGNEHERLISLKKAAMAAEEAFSLSWKKYQAGLSAFSEVLENQKVFLSLRDQIIQREGALASNLVELIKALGGGSGQITDVSIKGGIE
ncbi:MAG: TolC family protein [Deltaproteobacteria bacterium]|nr:TolC family protein [Deltaproteobacteria bacterium]